jgi:hypothetical protein
VNSIAARSLFAREVNAGAEKAQGDDARHQCLPQVLPAKREAGVDHPQDSETEPDRRGAHSDEDITGGRNATRATGFASISCRDVDCRLLNGVN